MTRNLIILLICIEIFSACEKNNLPDVSTNKEFNNPLANSIDSAVHLAYTKNKDSVHAVGMSIGLYKNGKFYYYGYGETVKGNKTVPNENTFFEIGSISKTYTAIAIQLMLLEKGLTLNQTIKEYLPDSVPVLKEGSTEVSFKHLLNHTSGLPNMPPNLSSDNSVSDFAEIVKMYDNNKLFSALKQNILLFEPGSNLEYSNTAYALLSVLLEQHYKTSFAKLMQQKIFDPLSLSETKCQIEDTDLTRWTKGYDDEDGAVSYLNDWKALAGAGALKSTVTDVLKYGIANLNPPSSLLGQAIRQSHEVSYLPFIDLGRFKMNSRLGWFQYINNEVPNGTFIFHNGATGGYNSDLFIHPQTKSVLVVLYNTRYNGSDRQSFTTALHKVMLQ